MDREGGTWSRNTVGDIVQCSNCREYSAFEDADVDPQPDCSTGAWHPLGWVSGEVAKLEAVTNSGWYCGHCGVKNAYSNSTSNTGFTTEHRAAQALKIEV